LIICKRDSKIEEGQAINGSMKNEEIKQKIIKISKLDKTILILE
jgi:hypothetical protein